MNEFTAKSREQIAGVLSGFDRLVLRGSLRRLDYGIWDAERKAMRARGMEQYLWQNGILHKDYAGHMKQVSERIKKASQEPFRQQDLPVIFLRSSQVDKDEVARAVARERKISSGLVCVISSLEPSPTFEYYGSWMVRLVRPCHVPYHYQIDAEVGWMYARLQTWFPLHIQIGLNGAGVAGETDAAGRAEILAGRELLCLDRGL